MLLFSLEIIIIVYHLIYYKLMITNESQEFITTSLILFIFISRRSLRLKICGCRIWQIDCFTCLLCECTRALREKERARVLKIVLPFLCAAPLSHVISFSSRLSNLCKYDSIYIRFCENKNDANSWVINDREWKKKKMKLNARFCKDFSAEQFVQWFEIECGVIDLLLSALLGLPQNDTSMKKIYLLFDSQLEGDT